MSFNVRFVAKDRTAAVEKIEQATETAAKPYGIPPRVASVITDRLLALPADLGRTPSGESLGVLVETSGHFDTNGSGDCSIKIELVPVL